MGQVMGWRLEACDIGFLKIPCGKNPSSRSLPSYQKLCDPKLVPCWGHIRNIIIFYPYSGFNITKKCKFVFNKDPVNALEFRILGFEAEH